MGCFFLISSEYLHANIHSKQEHCLAYSPQIALYTPHFPRKLSDSGSAFTETCKAFPQCTFQHLAGSFAFSLSAISNGLKVQSVKAQPGSGAAGRAQERKVTCEQRSGEVRCLPPIYSTHSSPKPLRLLSWL